MALISCSPSSRIVNLHLAGDRGKTESRFIKVAAMAGPRVLFAQTYSCDHKDCWPTAENVSELQSLYGPAAFSTQDMTAVQLKRQVNHQSVLRWKGPVRGGPVVVRAALYSGKYTEISRAEQTMNSGLVTLWTTRFRVEEKGSGIEISSR
ncbi:hypothetical protein ACFSC4_07825 [Deinococcus malanensis]